MKVEKIYKLAYLIVSFGKRSIKYDTDGALYIYNDKEKFIKYNIEKYFKVKDKYCGKRKNGYNEPAIIIKTEQTILKG